MRTKVTVDPATTGQPAPRFPVPYSETCQGPLLRSTCRGVRRCSKNKGARLLRFAAAPLEPLLRFAASSLGRRALPPGGVQMDGATPRRVRGEGRGVSD